MPLSTQNYEELTAENIDSAPNKDGALFNRILNQQDSLPHASSQEGFFIARIAAFSDDGSPMVTVDGFLSSPTLAISMCTLDDTKIGDLFGLMFQNGQLQRPVLMGKLQQSILTLGKNADCKVEQSQDYVSINAGKEIHLQCGDSHLLLTADGHAEIRGKRVINHSTGLNRIRGASVRIN